MGEVVEFTPLLRQYLASIGKIHLEVRELLNSDVLKWEEIIQAPIIRYKEATGYNDGLSGVSIDELEIAEKFSMFVDFIERRRMLENKNRYLTHYSSNFISNEAPEFTVE